MSPCNHATFAGHVTVHRLEDRGAYTADVGITCAECKEPFRFIGLPVGAGFQGASVDLAGTELRVNIEPESTKHERNTRPQAFERYICDPATKLVHDRWFPCGAAEDGILNAFTKPGSPYAYFHCPACDKALREAAVQEKRDAAGKIIRDAIAGTETETDEATSPESPAVGAHEAAVAAEAPAGVVVPLEAQEATPGQPAPAAAAIMLPPDPGDADPDDDAAPVGQIAPRNRGGGGRNR